MPNLLKRVLSSLVLVPVFLGVLYVGSPYSLVFTALIWVLALLELYMITQKLPPPRQAMSFLLGFMYLGLAYKGLYGVIKSTDVPHLVIFLTLLVWASDIGGYIWGRLVGGPKLAMRVSPNKTWSGAVGAMIMTAVSVQIMRYNIGGWDNLKPLQVMYMGFIVSVIVQLGDLFESAFKRFLQIKDSGSLIPGHGGVLDRLDGYFSLFFVLGIATKFVSLSRILISIGVRIP